MIEMKTPIHLGHFGSAHLFLLTILLLSLWQCSGADGGLPKAPGAGPNLHVTSVYGNLELGRPSSIFVVLENGALPGTSPADEDDPAFQREAARGIVAYLASPEGGIEILSGPQMAGLLAGGESTILQFSALAEGLPLGIYPINLRCNYSRLSQVASGGDDGPPSLVFDYEKTSIEFPLKAEIAAGPRVEIEEEDGWGSSVAAGEEAELELRVANQGDEPAQDLQIQFLPRSPFLMVENRWAISSIAPGERAAASLNVFTDENASYGCYALPCQITYKDGPDGEIRREEKAALVYVGERPYSIWIYPAAACLILLLLALLWLAHGRRRSGQRRIRIVKS
jgi:hypothetical protein